MNDLNPPPQTTTPQSHQEVACNRCGMFGMCMEAGLSRDERLLTQVVSRRTPVPRHATLVQNHAPFDYLYAVKSGSLAAVDRGQGEGRRILGFYFPGDLIGLEAIESGQYHQTVVALERSSICRLDYAKVPLLGEHQAGFYRQLLHAMSQRLIFEQWSSRLLGAHTTEQRIASFLLYLSSHLHARGLPYLEFRLPMTRADIASYLGMAMETVSRSFSALQKGGLVALKGRTTRLCDLQGLHQLAELSPQFTTLA